MSEQFSVNTEPRAVAIVCPKLSQAECRAIERAFLGGMEALRTPDYSCACSTVSSLMRKGIFGRDGLTELGRTIGRMISRPPAPAVQRE